MATAVTFALLSLFFAGILDVCFKLYARISNHRGVYLAICGAAWTTVQLVFYFLQDIELSIELVTLMFGITAGLCLALANLVFVESLTHLNISLGSTIYRLNTVGVVIFALIFLGEPIGVMKILGVVSAVVAVWMLYQPPVGKKNQGEITIFLWMAIMASAMRAAFGVMAKAAIVAGANQPTLLLFYAILWVPVGLVYANWRENNLRPSRESIAYGIVTGIILCLVANFLIAALRIGDASTMVPIANLSFTVTLLISTVIGLEKLTWRKIQAVTLAGVAIYFLANG